MIRRSVMRAHSLSLLLALLAALSCAAPLRSLPDRIASGRVHVVDLSHTLDETSPFWPGGLPFKKELLVDYDKGYRMHKFTMAENVGTHMRFMLENLGRLDRVPPKGAVVVIGVVNVEGGTQSPARILALFE